MPIIVSIVRVIRSPGRGMLSKPCCHGNVSDTPAGVCSISDHALTQAYKCLDLRVGPRTAKIHRQYRAQASCCVCSDTVW